MRGAIYVRISRDRIGAGLGVDRQKNDCLTIAAREGTSIEFVLTDNDISAYSGKPRPGYERLLHLIRSGEIDVVLAWHTDRLHRSPLELEEFISACELHDVAVRTVQAGALDLSNASGRMGARIYGAVARHEVEHAIERQKAAKLQAARQGLFSGGQRPYGFTAGCKEIYEPEAAIVRQIAMWLLEGRSFRQIAIELKQRGVTTQHGKTMRPVNVRNLMTHARYAGIREHNGEQYPAVWPALFTLEEWDDIQTAIRARAKNYSQKGPMRKFLGTGKVYCGNCGKRMNTCPKKRADGTYYTRYTCRSRNSTGEIDGCGTVHRIIEPVDHFIGECIIYRLETAAFDAAVAAGETASDDLKEAMKKQRVQAMRVQEIRDDYATGELSKNEYQSLLATAQARLEDLTRQVNSMTAKSQLHGLPVGHRARPMWENATLEQKRAVQDILIDKVIINKSDVTGMFKGQYYEGRWKFRPEDIDILWLV